MEPSITTKVQESAFYTRYSHNQNKLRKANDMRESVSATMKLYDASINKFLVTLPNGSTIYVDSLSNSSVGIGQPVNTSGLRSLPIIRY